MKAGNAIVNMLAACLVMWALVACLVIWAFEDRWHVPEHVTERATFLLPDGAGEMTFIRHHQEPLIRFLADVAFDRKIVLRRAGEPERTWDLPLDLSNMSFNVYWISDGEKSFVRFNDAEYDYLLDLQSNVLCLVLLVRGVWYAGQMDDGHVGYGVSGPVDDDASTLSVHVGRHEAVPLAVLTSGTTETYIGNISGISHEWRFTPAEDSPELPVKTRGGGSAPAPRTIWIGTTPATSD